MRRDPTTNDGSEEAPMTGPRFKPLPPEQMTAEQKRVAQALSDGPRGGVRGPFPALLRIPAFADRVRILGDYVRFESTLPPALTELAILVVARFWTAQYEWYAHSRHAVKAGLDPSVPEAIAQGKRPPKLSADETLIYDFCSELLNARDVSDETFAAAVARFGEATVLDLVGVAAYYSFVSLILNANRTPVPADGTPLRPLAGT
jgi:4-carboxymuconolactone decarboxylase